MSEAVTDVIKRCDIDKIGKYRHETFIKLKRAPFWGRGLIISANYNFPPETVGNKNCNTGRDPIKSPVHAVTALVLCLCLHFFFVIFYQLIRLCKCGTPVGSELGMEVLTNISTKGMFPLFHKMSPLETNSFGLPSRGLVL